MVKKFVFVAVDTVMKLAPSFDNFQTILVPSCVTRNHTGLDTTAAAPMFCAWYAENVVELVHLMTEYFAATAETTSGPKVSIFDVPLSLSIIPTDWSLDHTFGAIAIVTVNGVAAVDFTRWERELLPVAIASK